MIPDLDPVTGRLPYVPLLDSPLVTAEEVGERYAGTAHRAACWKSFLLWLDRIEELDASRARIFLSGSFLTDRPRPSDVDVLVLFDPGSMELARPAIRARAMWTWEDVSAVVKSDGTTRDLGRLQPYGGLVDAHGAPSAPDAIERWSVDWTTEYNKADHTPTGVRMGCLEVKR